jgi:RNA polymerase sigma-70 factor (ECF subfamily)
MAPRPQEAPDPDRKGVDGRPGRASVDYPMQAGSAMSSESAGETQLLARARGGDRASFELLTRGHIPVVYRMLFRFVGNHEDAEDLTQEAFAKAWSALAGFRGGPGQRTWIRRIALNLARDHLRSAGRRARPLEELAGTIALAELARRGPSEDLERKDLVERVRAELLELPLRLRVPLVLRALEGLEYVEIAAIARVTPATARAQVMQARRELLRRLGNELGPAGSEGAR